MGPRAHLAIVLSISACLTDPATFASDGGGEGGLPGGASPGGWGAGGGDTGGDGGGTVGGGSAAWLRTFGDGEDQLVHGIAVAPDGSIFLGGEWRGEFPLAPINGTCGGAKHGFVMKLDPAGAPLWLHCFGGSASVSAVSASSAGVAAIGTFANMINVGHGAVPSAGDTDVFLVRLDSAGQIVSGHTFGDALTDRGLGVAMLEDKVFASGSFRGDITIGDQPLSASTSGADLFVARMDADGSIAWARRLANGSAGPQLRIAVSEQGDTQLVGAGYFTGAFDVDAVEGPYPTYVPSTALEDAFIAGFDGEGDVTFFTPIASDGRERALTVAVLDNRFLVTGSFDAELDVDQGGDLPVIEPLAATDAFIVTGTLSGDLETVSALDGDGDESVLSANWTTDSGVAVGGEFDGALNLRAGTASAPDGNEDAFVLAWTLTDANRPTLARTFGPSAGVQRVEGLAARDGSLYAAGSFTGTLDVGALQSDAAGGFDIFIAKLP